MKLQRLWQMPQFVKPLYRARIITCVKIVGEQVFLLAIYDKSEKHSISDNERDNLLKGNDLL